MVESRSIVRGASPGPAPAAQDWASNSRLTRSSWRTCPYRKLRRKVPTGTRSSYCYHILGSVTRNHPRTAE